MILCDSIEIINESFTHQILFVYLFLLVSPLSKSFIIIRSKKSISSSFQLIFFGFKNIFQYGNIFTAYGIFYVVFRLNIVVHVGVYFVISSLFLNYIIVIVIAYIGAGTTREARATAAIIGGIMDDDSDSQMFNFIYLMLRIRTRNLVIENFLFRINWKTLMMVRNSKLCRIRQ